jgi:CRP-like cAMP-binding protein
VPGRNQFLRALSPPLFEKVASRLRAKDYASGDVLFFVGDKIVNIYFFHTGGVSLVLELANGEMVESAMVGNDSLVAGGAALDAGDAVYKAIVQIPGSASTLDVDAARQIARESEEFRSAIIRHEQVILAQAQQSAACNATHNLQERLARWLLRVRDAIGSDRLNLTQEFIAEMLGVRRSSVSLVAHQLQQGGLISYRRGQIVIEDLEGLRESACECYGTIKAHYDRLLQSPRT